MSAPYYDVYAALAALGVPMDSHESDLYVPVTPETSRVVRESGWTATTFCHAVDGTPWYDIPFAYRPWWERRAAHEAAP